MNESAHEYLLLIEPKGNAEQKTNEIKCVFGRDYKCAMATSKPHITVAYFLLVGRRMEARVLKYLTRFLSSCKPFDLEIDGFDHFLTHTIFLKVNDNDSIKTLVKDIRKKFRKYLMPDEKFPPFFCTTPHLTIARRMAPEQFNKAWPIWQNHELKVSFNVNELVLIKRRFFEKDRYRTLESFQLKGLGEDGLQLKLPF